MFGFMFEPSVPEGKNVPEGYNEFKHINKVFKLDKKNGKYVISPITDDDKFRLYKKAIEQHYVNQIVKRLEQGDQSIYEFVDKHIDVLTRYDEMW